MAAWEWETFEQVLNGHLFRVTSLGPLHGPVSQFKITRNNKRDLVLETTALGQPSARAAFPAGTVRRNTETVSFESEHGATAIAFGVRPEDTVTTDGFGSKATECRQTSGLQKLEIVLRANVTTEFTLDWVENLRCRCSHWLGEIIRNDASSSKIRTIGAGSDAIRLEGQDAKTGGISHAALRLEIDGVQMFVCSELHRPDLKHPGYIIYRGAPDNEFRRRVRDVVSFCLGNGLVYLGSTMIGADGHICETTAYSGNAYGDRIFEVWFQPPAPLGGKYGNAVDQRDLNRMANALYHAYDKLSFRSLTWAYWHAACAPVHMAAGHFGAAIEALQGVYRSNIPDKSRGRIVKDKERAQEALAAFRQTLADLSLSEDERDELSKRVANLNQASGAMISGRIMSELNLELGPNERSAWARRNDAAHGNELSEDEMVPMIRETKLLRIILNRMILRISAASSTYVDDYTIGHGIRPLSQPVPSRPEVF